jgi:carboxypeptidase C (cathepsin A)
MHQVFNFKASLIVAGLLAFPLAQAATMTKDAYKSGKDGISSQYKTNKAACDAMSANAKDICVEEAKAKERVALAELEYGYTGKARDGTKVMEVKAKTAYAVAKEKCDDQAGNAKDVCRKEAKAVETKALADAKMGKQMP